MTFACGLEAEVVFKRMKSIRLYVDAPEGTVRISSPCGTPFSVLDRFVCSRSEKIKKEQGKIRTDGISRQNDFVTGEKHFFAGREYALDVREEEASFGVSPRGEILVLFVPAESSRDEREKIMDGFYRSFLEEAVPPLMEIWEEKIGVKASHWSIRKMKTRWGSCTCSTGRIRLNLELAKKSPEALELVIVHELVHLLEKGHNKDFYAHMDRLLPDWRTRERELKKHRIG